MREFWVFGAGTRLFGVETGEGPAVVMLHGALANHQTAMALAAPLASAYRVVAPDLRGSGRSWFAGRLGFDLLADDIAAILDHLEIDRAVVGGVSSGSGVALRFAFRHPRRTLGVIVVKPVYAGADHGYSAEQHAAFSAMDRVASRATAEGIEALRPLYDQLPEAWRDRAWAVASGFDPASVVTSSRFVADGAQPFASAADLCAIEAPMLLVRGADAQHPREVSDLYAASVRDCTVVSPDAVDLATPLTDFCARCSGTGA
jgi:pimeloyl-ACP methyl ester carboxylesterase